MNSTLYFQGHRVLVSGYGPFHGLRGTIRAVHTVDYGQEEPGRFYLIALDEAVMQEPIWFTDEEVEAIDFAVALSLSQAESKHVEMIHV